MDYTDSDARKLVGMMIPGAGYGKVWGHDA